MANIWPLWIILLERYQKIAQQQNFSYRKSFILTTLHIYNNEYFYITYSHTFNYCIFIITKLAWRSNDLKIYSCMTVQHISIQIIHNHITLSPPNHHSHSYITMPLSKKLGYCKTLVKTIHKHKPILAFITHTVFLVNASFWEFRNFNFWPVQFRNFKQNLHNLSILLPFSDILFHYFHLVVFFLFVLFYIL